ncbi:hypothetical protein [Flindersiella endophytica]
MHMTHVTKEVWLFTCLGCGHSWKVGYEARHADDGSDGEVCLWLRGGLPSTAPSAGQPCPSCADLRVTGARESEHLPPLQPEFPSLAPFVHRSTNHHTTRYDA